MMSASLILNLIAVLGNMQVTSIRPAGGQGIAWDRPPLRPTIYGPAAWPEALCELPRNCHSAACMRYNRLTDIGLSGNRSKTGLSL